MNSINFVKAAGLWLVFLAVAIVCGFIRERILVPGLGPLAGRALGTLLVGLIIFGLIYVHVGKIKGATPSDLFKLGVGWTIATITFEFLFGHFVMGLAWESLWADYNIFQGRLWPLVLIVTWVGPLLARKIRDYVHGRQSA
jgi:hypothetical protein